MRLIDDRRSDNVSKHSEVGQCKCSPLDLVRKEPFRSRPLRKVVDPTGAGDSFVGGLMGYLATTKGPIDAQMRRAMAYGSVVASFCCEGFGLRRTTGITRMQIDQRVKELERLTKF